MAVIIEAITVVVRRDAARRVFAGNDAPLAALAPNPSGRQDEHLYAVGFMNQLDAEAFIRRALEPRGLTWTQGDQAVDLTLVDQFTGLFHYTPWLEVGQYPVKGGAVTAAWLTGTEPGALSTHAYWNLKDYLDLSRAPLEEDDAWQEIPSDDPRLRVMLNLETGEKRYAIRPQADPAAVASEEVQGALDSLEKVWRTVDYVTMANDIRRFGGPAPDVQAYREELERILPTVRSLARHHAPLDARTHFTEGYILTALERPMEAEPALRQAHHLDPQSARVASELMSTLTRLGRQPEAIAVGWAALPRQTSHPLVPYHLATLLHGVGENRKALEVLQGLLAAHPEYEPAKKLKHRIEAMGSTAEGTPKAQTD